MNKLTKVLSVFIIAGVIGTGAAGIAGCKKDKGHTHSYSYTTMPTELTTERAVAIRL